MANIIKVKKSSVAEKVPTADQLDYGEMALNYTDEKLYIKNSGNTVVEVLGGGGGGIASIQSDYAWGYVLVEQIKLVMKTHPIMILI